MLKMRTRRAFYSSSVCEGAPAAAYAVKKRPQPSSNGSPTGVPKKIRLDACEKSSCNAFDALHDDLIVSIMVSLSSTATSPADLVNMMLTCKRFFAMGTHHLVLANAGVNALAVDASRWSESAYRYLKRFVDAGNVEAWYTLGMIRFYSLYNRAGGASLMAKAAMASHAGALHSLAVIQFNGSGGTRKDKDLKAGVALCARAASLGHVDAMRELGHCLQDGYGVMKNIIEGRRLLLEANAREAAAAVASSPQAFMETALQLKVSSGIACLHHRLHCHPPSNKEEPARRPLFYPIPANSGEGFHHHPVYRLLQRGGCSLLSDFGCNVPPAEIHIANKFLVDWFRLHPPGGGLRLCSHANCGRPETRRHEFRRCSACGTVNYCSRACQALDWKIRHKLDCQPVADWEEREENEAEEGGEEEEEGGNAAATEEMEVS